MKYPKSLVNGILKTLICYLIIWTMGIAEAAQLHFLYTTTIYNTDGQWIGEVSPLSGTLIVEVGDPYGSAALTTDDLIWWSFTSRFFGVDSQTIHSIDSLEFTADYHYDEAAAEPIVMIRSLLITRAWVHVARGSGETFQSMDTFLDVHIANNVARGYWHNVTWQGGRYTNFLSNFSQTGTAIPKVVGSFLPALSADTDEDGIEDACDSCRYVWNPGQTDTNADNIGDACQCGDVDRDGVLTTTDALLIARGMVTDPDDLARCDVSGDAENACNTTDALLIARGRAPATPEGQTCPAYTGE